MRAKESPDPPPATPPERLYANIETNRARIAMIVTIVVEFLFIDFVDFPYVFIIT
jgi:hypothetical protein